MRCDDDDDVECRSSFSVFQLFTLYVFCHSQKKTKIVFGFNWIRTVARDAKWRWQIAVHSLQIHIYFGRGEESRRRIERASSEEDACVHITDNLNHIQKDFPPRVQQTKKWKLIKIHISSSLSRRDRSAKKKVHMLQCSSAVQSIANKCRNDEVKKKYFDFFELSQKKKAAAEIALVHKYFQIVLHRITKEWI